MHVFFQALSQACPIRIKMEEVAVLEDKSAGQVQPHDVFSHPVGQVLESTGFRR